MSIRIAGFFFWLTILGLAVVTVPYPAPASSDLLTWKPYLQQVTDSSIIIVWATQGGTKSVVRYGPDLSYSLEQTGTSRAIPLEMQLHRVELKDLQPQTLYHYKIYVDEEELLPEETLSFQTAPPPGSDTPVTFIAFGD